MEAITGISLAVNEVAIANQLFESIDLDLSRPLGEEAFSNQLVVGSLEATDAVSWVVCLGQVRRCYPMEE